MMKRTVLIVDNEESTRESLRIDLENHYDVCIAEDGESAIQLLEKDPFDVLLTELRLPAMTGIDLIKRAKSLTKSPVCIILTAWGTEKWAVDAMRQGADDYMSRTGMQNIDELVKRIESAFLPIDPVWEAVQVGEQLAKCHEKFREHQRSEDLNGAGDQALEMLDAVQKGIHLHEGENTQRDERLGFLKFSLQMQLGNGHVPLLLKWLRPRLKGLNDWYKENYQQKADNLGSHVGTSSQYPKNLESETKRWGDCPDNFLRWRTLAWFFSENGPKPNSKRAFKWSHRVAIHGDAKAQHNLGRMYANGSGSAVMLNRDNVKAYAWLSIAASNGHPSAEEKKASLGLTPDQITQVEALIKELLEKYPQAQNSH